MKAFRMAVLVLLIGLLGGSISFADSTWVSGTISGETWTPAGSPYCVNGDIMVASLTIEPGVVVGFFGEYDFDVTGVLSAVGTVQDSIIFTKADPDTAGWGGIFFDHVAPGSELAYCKIELAANHGLHIYNCEPTIRNCTITNNSIYGPDRRRGAGIYIDIIDSLSLNNCHIESNVVEIYYDGYGGGIYLKSGILTVNNSIIGHNHVAAGTWHYAVGGGIFVSENGTLLLKNCAIAYNSVSGDPGYGGGVYASAGTIVTTINSIFYFNSNEQIYGEAIVTYSDIQGGWEGEGNIDYNPNFHSPDSLIIVPGSPCIDAGNPDSIYYDLCFPPSLGTERNDMGAHGGPGGCGWLPGGTIELVYNADDFIFAIPEDSIVSRTFGLVSHNATGYVNSLCNADWVYITPDSVNLSPDDTSIVTVYFNSEGLAYITHHTNIRFESNVEGLENEVIPVEMTVFTPLSVHVDIADSILHYGDLLSVSITIENPTGSMVDAWMATGMELPNGNIYGPVFGPWNFGMLPHGTLSGRLDHVVPGIAPIGDYRYIVKTSSSRRFDFILGEGDHGFEIAAPGGSGGNGIIAQRNDPGEWVTVFSEFTGYADPVSRTDIENIPVSSALLQNYPNPFNATTEISFALANSGNVSLKIYNLTGQLIETLIDNRVEAGLHTVTWNASLAGQAAYSSGIYFYKLTTEDKVFTKRMTLLK